MSASSTADLADPARNDGRPVHRRHDIGRSGAGACRSSGPRDRPAGDHRQSRRRRRQYRRKRRREGARDGYTLLLATTGPAATNKLMYKDMTFDPQRDFAPIVLMGKAPIIIVARPDAPAKTLKDLIAYAKAESRQADRSDFPATARSATSPASSCRIAPASRSGKPNIAAARRSSPTCSADTSTSAWTRWLHTCRRCRRASCGPWRSPAPGAGPALPDVPTVCGVRPARLRGERVVRTTGADRNVG